METYRRLEDLVVYQKLCRLHIEIGGLTHLWPAEEKFELGSQARRSSNSAAAQLAEKYDDRHVRNKSDRRWPKSSVREDAGTDVLCVSGFPES